MLHLYTNGNNKNKEESMTRKLIALSLLASLFFIPQVTFGQEDPEALFAARDKQDGAEDGKTELITKKSTTGEITTDERCCCREVEVKRFRGGIVDFAALKIDKCPSDRETQFTLRNKETGNRVCVKEFVKKQ